MKRCIAKVMVDRKLVESPRPSFEIKDPQQTEIPKAVNQFLTIERPDIAPRLDGTTFEESLGMIERGGRRIVDPVVEAFQLWNGLTPGLREEVFGSFLRQNFKAKLTTAIVLGAVTGAVVLQSLVKKPR